MANTSMRARHVRGSSDTVLQQSDKVTVTAVPPTTTHEEKEYTRVNQSRSCTRTYIDTYIHTHRACVRVRPKKN